MEVVRKEVKTGELPKLCQPYPWLLICNTEEDKDRQIFYNIVEDQTYICLLSELQNKYVTCCYKEWLVLKDNSTNDWYLLNILTKEKLQLPPLNVDECHHCVLSQKNDGRGWNIIFIEKSLYKARLCDIGDTEFVEHNLNIIIDRRVEVVFTATIFKGKLYAFTMNSHLVMADLSNQNLSFECVVNGKSLEKLLSQSGDPRYYLVESSDELLFIFMSYWDNKVEDVKILRVDFSKGEWIRLDRIGDRAIFLDSMYGFSFTASVNGLKRNSIYLVDYDSKVIYVYDIEDQSLTMSMPCPFVNTANSSAFWMCVLNS